MLDPEQTTEIIMKKRSYVSVTPFELVSPTGFETVLPP